MLQMFIFLSFNKRKAKQKMNIEDLAFYVSLGVVTSIMAVCFGKILITIMPIYRDNFTTDETSIV